MAEREYTRWVFDARFAQGTGIRVGYICNKRRGNPEDVVRVIVTGLVANVEFSCRLDEAVILAAGLNKVAGQMLVGQLAIPAGKEVG